MINTENPTTKLVLDLLKYQGAIINDEMNGYVIKPMEVTFMEEAGPEYEELVNTLQGHIDNYRAMVVEIFPTQDKADGFVKGLKRFANGNMGLGFEVDEDTNPVALCTDEGQVFFAVLILVDDEQHNEVSHLTVNN